MCIPDGIGLLVRRALAGPPAAANAFLGRSLSTGWRSRSCAGRMASVSARRGAWCGRRSGCHLPGPLPRLWSLPAPMPDRRRAENEEIVARINESRADLLFVAYGAPQQDKWIARNRETLRRVRVAIGVGGSLDFVTGRAQRAPRWVQKSGSGVAAPPGQGTVALAAYAGPTPVCGSRLPGAANQIVSSFFILPR